MQFGQRVDAVVAAGLLAARPSLETDAAACALEGREGDAEDVGGVALAEVHEAGEGVHVEGDSLTGRWELCPFFRGMTTNVPLVVIAKFESCMLLSLLELSSSLGLSCAQ